jgi:fatty acid desaturase
MNPSPSSTANNAATSARQIEWPTWGLWVVILTSWLALAHWSAALPLWLGTPLMVLVLAWYLSFQHELTHGHPTRNATVNRLIGLLPLAIWYPFDTYKVDHLKHHEDAHLTEPGLDTESNYITPAQADGLGPVALWLYRTQRTFLGRLVIGPAIVIVSLLTKTCRQASSGEAGALKVWAIHLPLVALLLWALDTFAGISPWRYCFGMAYPALGLVMLRSLYEHRPGALPAHRTVINEAGIFWRLLFLNNNYHAVHHAYPELPWYRIPAAYAADRDGYHTRNGGFIVPGYGWLIRKFAWALVDSPVLSDPASSPAIRRAPPKATATAKS